MRNKKNRQELIHKTHQNEKNSERSNLAEQRQDAREVVDGTSNTAQRSTNLKIKDTLRVKNTSIGEIRLQFEQMLRRILDRKKSNIALEDSELS